MLDNNAKSQSAKVDLVNTEPSPGLGSLGLMSALLASEGFLPTEPQSFEQAGLSEPLVDSLIFKYLAAADNRTGRQMAEQACLPFRLLESRLNDLRQQQLLSHKAPASFNDYFYTLTPAGRERAHLASADSAYMGAAPVPLADYIASVDAQSISVEAPKRPQLEKAFSDISVSPGLLDRMGPAINSGAGLFLYGAPGNGKTTLAERITLCFGQEIWVPRAMIVDGQIIKFFDPVYHEVVSDKRQSLLRQETDNRWVKIRRPTVVVGGELTLDSLEIRHDPHGNISEAPLQMKSNCGVLLIDDFGRQRVDPVELLNRWIVPLEKRFDFLNLKSGKKIQVPFDQLIIFSTNLEPMELVDEAFLRRIPYKINIPDPDEEEFRRLFELTAPKLGITFSSSAVEHLLSKHYRPYNRPRRRCHPRDLLLQIHNFCRYAGVTAAMTAGLFDVAVTNYFTILGNEKPPKATDLTPEELAKP